ncbi:MAG: type II toxin-antitoxin system RelE/ParE family toxin [Verrucomicrobia bacterium]|nr:type II toxin-antitoxin system RelE/ParE family toxin [Verrucomicrobiota bacterium]
MSLPLLRRDTFEFDVAERFRWYLEEAGEEIAQRFKNAVDETLDGLSPHPGLGRRRRFPHPLLTGLRSFRVEPPFNKVVLFYRITDTHLEAWRLMHGSRDLSRRLLEPPGLD